MADYEDGIFSNLPRRGRRPADDDNTRSFFREALGMYVPEGPLPPRPERPRPSGKGGPSIGQGGGTPVVTSVWSAADAAANAMTLTNGGLTVTSNVSGGYQTVRGTVSQTAGKMYIEFKMVGGAVDLSVGDPEFGIATSGFSPLDYLGHNPISAGSFSGATGGLAPVNPSSDFTMNYTIGGVFPALNDVWAIAVDLTTGKYWVAQNNVWFGSGNPGTGVNPMISIVGAGLGQAYFPAMALRSGASTTGVWTLQSTAASQKYAPPAGFSAWDAPALTPAQAYLARTVGGNEGGNAANITALINGLVTDGVWSKLDCLYVLAQQNATDSLLNLIGTSYTATNAGATFTAYVGYSGFSANQISTGYNTSAGAQFKQNNASMGVWSKAVAGSNGIELGSDNLNDNLLTDYLGSFYARVNGQSAGISSPSTPGLYTGDRSSSTGIVQYYNGAAQTPVTIASVAPVNATLIIGAGGVGVNPSFDTISAAFIGGSLGAAGQLALYNRLNTYMTAVGGAGLGTGFTLGVTPIG